MSTMLGYFVVKFLLYAAADAHLKQRSILVLIRGKNYFIKITKMNTSCSLNPLGNNVNKVSLNVGLDPISAPRSYVFRNSIS